MQVMNRTELRIIPSYTNMLVTVLVHTACRDDQHTQLLTTRMRLMRRHCADFRKLKIDEELQ